jgi:hypothetical protein
MPMLLGPGEQAVRGLHARVEGCTSLGGTASEPERCALADAGRHGMKQVPRLADGAETCAVGSHSARMSG